MKRDYKREYEAILRDLRDLRAVLSPRAGQTLNDRARELTRYSSPRLEYLVVLEK